MFKNLEQANAYANNYSQFRNVLIQNPDETWHVTFHLFQDHEEALREHGRKFGYPQCCIDDFIQRFIDRWFAGSNWHDETRPWYGTGYVPCPSCDSKIKTPLDLVQILVAQPRFVCTEYPQSR